MSSPKEIRSKQEVQALFLFIVYQNKKKESKPGDPTFKLSMAQEDKVCFLLNEPNKIFNMGWGLLFQLYTLG